MPKPQVELPASKVGDYHQPLKKGDCVQYTGAKFQLLYKDMLLTIHEVDRAYSVASCCAPDGKITTWLPFGDLKRTDGGKNA
jgi:hypothetical protein